MTQLRQKHIYKETLATEPTIEQNKIEVHTGTVLGVRAPRGQHRHTQSRY